LLWKSEVRCNAPSFKTCFRPTHLVSQDDLSLRIRVPNSWFAEWLHTNYLPVIQDVLREIERPGLSVEFVHEGEPPQASRAASRPAPPTAQESVDALPGWLN